MANPLAQSLAEFANFPRTKDQQRNSENHQKFRKSDLTHKSPLEHRSLYSTRQRRKRCEKENGYVTVRLDRFRNRTATPQKIVPVAAKMSATPERKSGTTKNSGL